MPSCEEIRGLIEDYAGGEIAPSELALLEDHAGRCVDCRALLELHHELLAMDAPAPAVSEAELQTLRAGVIDRIGQNAAPQALNSPWRLGWAAAAMPREDSTVQPSITESPCERASVIASRAGSVPPDFTSFMLMPS